MKNFQAMKNFVNHKGKGFYQSLRRSPVDSLSSVIKFFPGVYCLLLAFMIVSSCGNIPDTAEENGMTEADEMRTDTMEVVIRTKASWAEDRTPPIERLDIFIYGYGGLRQLESHVTLKGGGSERSDTLRCTVGRKIIVAIANSPLEFNLTALAKMDGMELLNYKSEDDSPEVPVMSASTEADAGNAVEMTLKPLMCRVRLAEISNTMAGYRLIEEPQVYLCDCNPAAEALRQKDFRPKEPSPDTVKVPLPYDIGVFTQHPGTELFCYPNDTPENILGSPRTSMGLECRIDGKKAVFEFPLPPLKRAACVDVSISVDGPDSYTCSVW